MLFSRIRENSGHWLISGPCHPKSHDFGYRTAGVLWYEHAKQLVLVEEVLKAELDDELKDAIKERIFSEWLAQILKGGITVQA